MLSILLNVINYVIIYVIFTMLKNSCKKTITQGYDPSGLGDITVIVHSPRARVLTYPYHNTFHSITFYD
jgi:hypothetical protein